MALNGKTPAELAAELEAELSAWMSAHVLGEPVSAAALADPRNFAPEEVTLDGRAYVVEGVRATYDEKTGALHTDLSLRPKDPMLAISFSFEDEFDAEFPLAFDETGAWTGYER